MVPPRRIPWVAGLQGLGNRGLDRIFGIETATPVDLSELGFGSDTGSPYQASNWVNLIGLVRVLRELEVAPSDVFLDLGCGKGQVLFVAAHFPFGRVIGLDVSERMISVARRNLEPARRGFRAGGVDLLVEDAAEYEWPAAVNTCYLYNPFPRPVMDRVLANLDASLAECPRRMRLLYLEAVDADLLRARGFREARSIRRLRLFARDA